MLYWLLLRCKLIAYSLLTADTEKLFMSCNKCVMLSGHMVIIDIGNFDEYQTMAV